MVTTGIDFFHMPIKMGSYLFLTCGSSGDAIISRWLKAISGTQLVLLTKGLFVFIAPDKM